VARSQKAQQERRPVHPTREKTQEGERKLRRAEKEKAACVAKPQEMQ